MRSAARPMLISSMFFAFLFFAKTSFSQYYIDASANLPDNGTSAQAKDVLAVDIDSDDDMDIILAHEFQNNVILLNNGLGVFVRGNVGIPAGEEHDSEAIAVADFDLNGAKDIIFVSEDDFEHEYYWNVGDGTLETPSISLPFTVCRAVLAEDFNNDDIPDLMLGNDGQNMILINNGGTGEFINESFDRIPLIEDLTQDIKASDVDMDGDIDLFIANEDINRLLINNGSGFFTDEGTDRLPQGLNIDSRTVLFEDVDMDGDDDIFLCNVEFSPGKDAQNRLFLNDGSGFFEDVTEAYLPAFMDQSLDAVFTDFDFDGDPDLLVANVLGIPIYAYTNNGAGIFSEATDLVFGGSPIAIEAFGIAKADFNGDGFEDIYICNRDGKDKLLIRDPEVVSASEIYKSELQVFPNPIEEYFTVTGIEENNDLHFELTTISGNFIHALEPVATNASSLEFRIPENLTNGFYILNIRSKTEYLSFPLIIK